jgi:hypothetical protein
VLLSPTRREQPVGVHKTMCFQPVAFATKMDSSSRVNLEVALLALAASTAVSGLRR